MLDNLYVASKRCDPKSLDTEVYRLIQDDGDAFGLVMTPNVCGFCTWRHDRATGNVKFEGDLDIEEAFEIRAFCEHWELRWIRDRRDGYATLIYDGFDVVKEAFGQLSDWSRHQSIALSGVLERRYLLWGEIESSSSSSTKSCQGWLTLGSNRTGPVPVPFFLDSRNTGTRIQIVAREYLAKFDHGNICVFDQRLLRLIRAVN